MRHPVFIRYSQTAQPALSERKHFRYGRAARHVLYFYFN
jgi:hypothetical protein